MKLASRSPSFRVLAIAAALASVAIAPVYAQEEDDSVRSSEQREARTPRADIETESRTESDRARQLRQVQQRQEMRRDNPQHQQQGRSAPEAAARQQARHLFDQREQALQAQRASQMQFRAERDRQGDGDGQRERTQQRELAQRQQRGIDEREAAQQRTSDPRQRGRNPRRDEGERSALVLDEQRRQALREADGRRGADARQHAGREQQERRIAAERHNAQRYHNQREGYHRIAEQRARALQQQRRIAQYQYQQQYYHRLQQQQARWASHRYDYYSDPYYYTPASYRYSLGGRWHQTNRYGADLMRQAVDYGYREGLRAGRADRHDQWSNDYRNSYAYQDASYGYNGRYLGHDIYGHYFRQGFERGYQDAYSSYYRYGRRDGNGEYRVIAAVVTAILGLQLLR